MAFQKNVTLSFATQWQGRSEFESLNNALNKNSQKTEKAATGTTKYGKANRDAVPHVRNFGNVVRNVGSVIAGLGIGMAFRELAKAGLTAETAGQKIRSMAKDFGETEQVFEKSANAAEELHIGLTESEKGFGDLYARLRPMNVSLKDIESLFIGVSKAGKILRAAPEDVAEALRQMGQGLASNALMWEDLDIILQRVPTLGAEISRVLGNRGIHGDLKKLSSQGVITKDVMIEVARSFQMMERIPPTAVEKYTKAVSDLKRELGEELVPAITRTLNGITPLVVAFSNLPDDTQRTIVLVTALAGAFAILAPTLSLVSGLFGGIFKFLAGGKIFATIAGHLGLLLPIITGVKVAFAGLITLLAGPAGIPILGAILGATVFAMREQIGEFLLGVVTGFTEMAQTVGGIVQVTSETLIQIFKSILIEPFMNAWGSMTEFFENKWSDAEAFFLKSFDFLSSAFSTYVTDPIAKTWQGAMDAMKPPLVKFVDYAIKKMQTVWERIKEIAKGLNQTNPDAKPIVLSSATSGNLIQSLVDLKGEQEQDIFEEERKRMEQAEKQREKEAKARTAEIVRINVARAKYKRESLTLFNQVQSLMGSLKGGRQISVAEAMQAGEMLKRLDQSPDMYNTGKSLAQDNLARVAGVIGTNALSDDAYKLLQTPYNPADREVVINLATGPILRQSDTDYVSLDNYKAGLRRVALQIGGK